MERTVSDKIFSEAAARIAMLLQDVGIEYYAALPFDALKVTMPRLLDRHEGFTPRSALLFLLPYYTGEAENLSVYAVSRDYHFFFRELTERLSQRMKELYPDAVSLAFVDHSPIDERDAAVRAGLGSIGQNGLFLHSKYASYVFIAELITDLPVSALPNPTVPGPLTFCEGCGACRRACPTGILRGEAGADCLSAVTQRKGELKTDEIAMMRKYNTAWGCDLCQSACPHAKRATASGEAITPIPFFHEARTPRLTYALVAEMSEEEFSRRAYAWRGRKTILRNLSLLEDL